MHRTARVMEMVNAGGWSGERSLTSSAGRAGPSRQVDDPRPVLFADQADAEARLLEGVHDITPAGHGHRDGRGHHVRPFLASVLNLSPKVFFRALSMFFAGRDMMAGSYPRRPGVPPSRMGVGGHNASRKLVWTQARVRFSPLQGLCLHVTRVGNGLCPHCWLALVATLNSVLASQPMSSCGIREGSR